MLRVERIGKRLASFANLKTRPLEELYELGDFIANSPDEFFGEIGESVLLVANGVKTAEHADSYVDALAVDKSGAATVVILAPADAESPLNRAMSSASRLAQWTTEEFLRRVGPVKSQELRAYLAENYRDLNRKQRVLLVGEHFSNELLGTASWLSGGYGVDLACAEVTLSYDPVSGEEFLSCRLVTARPEAVEEPEKIAEEPAPAPEEVEPAPDPDPQFTSAEEPEQQEPPVFDEPEAFGNLVEAPAQMPDDLFEPAVEELAPTYEPERRQVARRSQFDAQSVIVQYAGRDMSTGLVDYNDRGVGLTMHSPLPVGMSIVVKGEFSWGETEVEIEKRGRVVHCNFLGQAFRLGILFTPSSAQSES